MKTIQSKFTFISAIAVFTLLALVFVSRWGASQAEFQAKELRLIAIVTQRHMEGDMMHDAMRGDVLGAILAGTQGNAEALRQAAKDLEEHYVNFKTNLSDNQKEQLPQDIRALFDGALVALENYYAAAKAVMLKVAAAEPYQEALSDFEQKFEAMEEENEGISNQITAWADKEDTHLAAVSEKAEKIILLLSVLTCLSVLIIPVFASRKLFKPQREMIENMDAMAKGEYDIAISGDHREDEIGNIARALLVFRNNGQERLRLEQEQRNNELRAEEEKRRAREELAARFESKVQGIIQSSVEAAGDLCRSSESMAQTITDASRKAGQVSVASSETSQNVQTVAAATEEMSASVREIAQQIVRSTSAIHGAVTEMQRADQTSKSLDEATQRIGAIIDLIQNIAGQINLLALNATIESARAGEAGKGFAVVAGEVKQLASQTAKATGEIAENISNIKVVADEVIGALQAISKAIASVEEISSSISAAVEEQTAVTNEIAKNMSHASGSTTQIKLDIGDVSTASLHASKAATQTLQSARTVSEQAERISEEVRTFLHEMRHG